MTSVRLPEENQFKGEVVENYVLDEERGRGNVGVVYRCHHKGIPQLVAAVKLIPVKNLTDDWETELAKAGVLRGIPQVVQYMHHTSCAFEGVHYHCIFWEWIEGDNLEEYARDRPEMITLPFVEMLAEELLTLFIAMQVVKISHDDLHERNILIAPDPRRPDPDQPTIKVADFGLGGSLTGASRKDDYQQLAVLCRNLLEHTDRSELDGEDKYFYDRFIGDFLRKKVLEEDPTVAEYVRDPGELLRLLRQTRADYVEQERPPRAVELEHAFDYLRCEQIGDSFELLQSLYAKSFPGYHILRQRTNTVLTGPRGCGKTTIFRNLSLKVQLLARSRTLDELEDYVGIYYHCNDLFFAFPHLPGAILQRQRDAILHFFGLGLLHEVLDTLVVAEGEAPGDWEPAGIRELEDFLQEWMPGYATPPQGTSVLRHLLSITEDRRHELRRWVAHGLPDPIPGPLLPVDFIPRLCSVLQEAIPWLKGRPVYFFLDDYSLPRVSEPIQRTLHDFIFLGYPNCFFKVASESVTTFCPYDSAGKLIEDTREYDVIDLGAQFLHAAKQVRESFIAEVIDNRLRQTPAIHEDYRDVRQLLGENPYDSYNELARQIAAPASKRQRVLYAGFETLVDLCSGDIAEILTIMRDIISAANDEMDLSSRCEGSVRIAPELQDRAMRRAGALFLHRIEAAERTGHKMRRVAEAFGRVAHWSLCNLKSKNVRGQPPKQAFRIELLDRLSLDGNEALERLYKDLVRYSVFLRDVRGKSMRGAIVDRLYLRRILIPTFRLTASQRDSIRLEVRDFFMLLQEPEKFERYMPAKLRTSEAQEELPL